MRKLLALLVAAGIVCFGFGCGKKAGPQGTETSPNVGKAAATTEQKQAKETEKAGKEKATAGKKGEKKESAAEEKAEKSEKGKKAKKSEQK